MEEIKNAAVSAIKALMRMDINFLEMVAIYTEVYETLCQIYLMAGGTESELDNEIYSKDDL